MDSIYGPYSPAIEDALSVFLSKLEQMDADYHKEHGEHIYEHVSYRIKSDESMREKCIKKGIPQTPESALVTIRDAIGVRIVCSFIDDLFLIIEKIRSFEGCRIMDEKDYIRHTKQNGYRSYHLILDIESSFQDPAGNTPGHFYAEIQLRTIAMDSWAALEHKVKYKKNIKNQAMIVSELKRCADELASCDLTMQTIRDLIRASDGDESGV